jgi:ADP-ribosylglycohydrolase
MLDRFKGAILLAAAADALGWITEFESDKKSSSPSMERIGLLIFGLEKENWRKCSRLYRLHCQRIILR